jgi:hypothetical protein
MPSLHGFSGRQLMRMSALQETTRVTLTNTELSGRIRNKIHITSPCLWKNQKQAKVIKGEVTTIVRTGDSYWEGVGRNLVMLWVVVPQVGQLVRVH